MIEKFAAVIRDAAANEAQRSDIAQLFDRSVADGRNLVTTGRRIAGWQNAGSPISNNPLAVHARAGCRRPAAPAFAAAPPPAVSLKSGHCGPRRIRQ